LAIPPSLLPFCLVGGVIFPWLSLEPFTYLVGLIVLLQMVYTICHAPSVKVVASWEKNCFNFSDQSFDVV
jgi:hypothetical protein